MESPALPSRVSKTSLESQLKRSSQGPLVGPAVQWKDTAHPLQGTWI